MNRLAKFVSVLALGVCGSLSSCSGGGGGGSGSGAMYIEACDLNCNSSGTNGGQVTCGVINVYQNQEIGVLFSRNVDFNTVSQSTFQIFDSLTGAVPVGSFVADPFDSRRVIFRPDLAFDINGNPIFGFKFDTSYDLVIPGTNQGDSPPFIESTGGTKNAGRLQCTVKTSLGINDPVVGPPLATTFVATATNPNTVANGATDVLLTSKVTMVFNDLMNIGTLVLPGSGLSPTITVKLDPDGNIANTSDQVALQGTFSFLLDQLALQTTVVFTPAQPFPSAGVNLVSLRKIIVNLPSGIKDLKGNSLGNPGPVIFTPELVQFQSVTIPTGGEQFTDLANCDQDRSGASWGENTPGQLTPGFGGGSGRLGDLTVASGDVLTLHTGATFGVGRITWDSGGPLENHIVDINGVRFEFVDSFTLPLPALGSGFVEFEGAFPALNLTNMVRELNFSVDPLVSAATYVVENGTTIKITYDLAGDQGQSFTFDAYKVSQTPGAPPIPIAGLTLSGPKIPNGTAHLLDGVDGESFAAGNLLDNFDYQASPGGTPNPVLVTNGNFEFATLNIESGGTLRFEGPNAARLLVRGKATVAGVIDVSGEAKLTQLSDSPQGQLGGLGGPNAGSGGAGADRPDNSPTNLLDPNPLADHDRPYGKGIVNPGGSIVGFPGVGVGQVGTIAAGPQGGPWPLGFPDGLTLLGGLQTNATFCASEQVGAPGGGGGYSLDGGIGVAVAESALASQGEPNTPPDTAGGDATNAGLEAPGAPLNKRKLTPEKGFLKGGSGGGGGGASVEQTKTDSQGSGDQCVGSGASINLYRSHSAAAGGGGGGAIQLQAGRSIDLSGGIDAAGGEGGSADASNLFDSATRSSPGGGGSGGAILMQARQLMLTAQPARMSIAGGGGGTGFPNTLGAFSLGGAGGAGLARIEQGMLPLPLVTDVASILEPYAPNLPTSLDYLSVGAWVRSRFTPASFQGAQSCWMRPTTVGNFFAVQFDADAPGLPGWDMDLVLNDAGGIVTVPYRSPNQILPPPQTYEQFWGQLLDEDLLPGELGAPLVVRFQGAKLSGAMPDPCNVLLSGPTSPIVQGSLTPWVRHPSELNAFSPAPDMIRFVITFDASKTDFLKIVGVKNLRIHALPN